MIFAPNNFFIAQSLALAFKKRGLTFGWFTTAFCSLFIYFLTRHAAFTSVQCCFSTIVTLTLCLSIFRLVPEYISALIILLSALLFHIAPQHIILSGYNSDSFFLALSVFSIGALLTKSRLFYRLSLILLIKIPSQQTLLQRCLFFLGVVMTPIMSVQSSRISLIAPLLDDIMESSKIDPHSNAANALANSAFNGCILLSTIFLTGKSSNFIIYGLLSEQHQWQGNWFSWLWLASFPGLLLIALFFTLQPIFFKTNKELSINRFQLRKELYYMGKPSFKEYTALISFFIFSLGSMLSAYFSVSNVWTCCMIFILLLLTGALDAKEIKTQINWGFLFYFGAIIGIMRTINTLGIDLWLISHMQWLTLLAQNNTALFITLIYVISWVGGLFLGTMIAPAILFTAILPFSLQSPVSNWVIAFIILIATEAWIFPYQASYFICFEQLLKRKDNFLFSPLLQLNSWFTLLKLVVILASIPFWYYLGVLS